MFERKPKLSLGYIITTPTSGPQDFFVVYRGKCIVYIPNKCNTNYNKSYLILGVLNAGSCFNEHHWLYGNGSTYLQI